MGRRHLDAGHAEGAVAAAADRAERTVEPGGRTCSRSEAFSSSTALPPDPKPFVGPVQPSHGLIRAFLWQSHAMPPSPGDRVREQQPGARTAVAVKLTGWEQSPQTHDTRAVEDLVRCSQRSPGDREPHADAGRCLGGGPFRAAAVSRSGSVTRAGSCRGRAEGRRHQAALRRMRSERTRRRWCARCAVPLRRACTRARSRVR